MLSEVLKLKKAAEEIQKQNLDFKIENTHIKEFDQVLQIDPEAYNRIFANLFENAISVNPESGTISWQIKSKKEQEKVWVDIIIQDSGPGFSVSFVLFSDHSE